MLGWEGRIYHIMIRGVSDGETRTVGTTHTFYFKMTLSQTDMDILRYMCISLFLIYHVEGTIKVAKISITVSQNDYSQEFNI